MIESGIQSPDLEHRSKWECVRTATFGVRRSASGRNDEVNTTSEIVVNVQEQSTQEVPIPQPVRELVILSQETKFG